LVGANPHPKPQAAFHLNQSGSVRTVDAGPPAPYLYGYDYTIGTHHRESPWPSAQRLFHDAERIESQSSPTCTRKGDLRLRFCSIDEPTVPSLVAILLPLVGYFELAFDDRIQSQAGEKAAEGNYSFEDHHLASCDESPFTVSLLNDLKPSTFDRRQFPWVLSACQIAPAVLPISSSIVIRFP
jgi:hypothetical protein